MPITDNYAANATLAIKLIEKYLYRSPYFFPEYTNHGILHINRVLEIADLLIPDDTFSLLSTRDISILVVSIYIHDLAMFIEKDGLIDILFGAKALNKTNHLDNLTWVDEWGAYIERIRRYSGSKLKKIYGDSEPVIIPNSDMKDLTNKDVLTYGDFLRQHHHRLAHEIAVDGFPGSKNTILLGGFESDFGKPLINLIGLVARSHGMSMRQTSDYIATFGGEDHYPLGVPVYYLMCIIRLADYLDAGCDRASHVIDNMQEKISSISKEEWSWNQIINYDNYKWNGDIATVNIHATPESSSQFVKVESWLKSVQNELDLCWAVLGEFYRNKYGLTIRRITSNLFKSASRHEFEKLFLPQSVAISANPDIVKLMIAPLYGNNPSFGVRELIQNAVDACNERDFIEKQKKEDYKAIINVSIDKDNRLFVIEDNGTGMSADVIANYFLVAGSSYRRSDAWLKSFADSEDESLVKRSGRFGVGFLATYLLGEKVTVTTRHIDDSLGYQFSVSIDDEKLDIQRIDVDYGTKIEIEVSTSTLEKLIKNERDYSMPESQGWSKWFFYKYPVINYYINEEEQNRRSSRNFIPMENNNIDGWFSVDIPDFQNVKWNIPNSQYDSSTLYCNGIYINNGTNKIFNDNIRKPFDFSINYPTISFTDYNGHLPINLARNEVYHVRDSGLIVKDIYRYILADLLCLDVKSSLNGNFIYKSGFINNYRYGRGHSYIPRQDSIIHSKSGYTLAAKPFLEGTHTSKVIICYFSYGVEKTNIFDFALWKNVAPICVTLTHSDKNSQWFYQSNFKCDTLIEGVKINGVSCCINKAVYDELLSKKKITKSFQHSITMQNECNNYYFISTKGKTASLISLDMIKEMEFAKPFILEYDIEFLPEKNGEKSYMKDILQEYLGQAGDYWIPYDFSERRKKFPLAFEQLSKYNKKM